ncbi:hypothetical protein M433DRAFT_7579 [Acidomyces richmondensis BFW]|nr:hypothetical protein M433DRAFT_7579 [Acidomyces richmondensis BFW]
MANDNDRQRMLDRLQEHFSKVNPEDQSARWNKMWEEQTTPWDRKAPSPALLDTLKERTDILGSPLREDGARLRAFVPGCGRGYDVMALASFGYDAYGLDVSELAIQAAEKERDSAGMEEKYPVSDTSRGRGGMKFINADFFKDDFLVKTGGGNFDLIYDYTFLCALPPDWRPRWAKRMSQLLSPTGHLICLEFPLAKPPKDPGPPFGLSAELYKELLSRPGDPIEYDADGHVRISSNKSGSIEGSLVQIARWKAQRTYKVGDQVDHVSVWQHRQK